jgi:hypothetical protein
MSVQPQDIVVEKPFEVKKGVDVANDTKLLKLKQELSDLIQLKEILNETDFEGKVNISTLIHTTQQQIDKINSESLELAMTTENIFDKLFAQSFNPLHTRYDDAVSRRGNETNITPNGNISDLNDDVQTLIKSDLFKEWFGDFQNAYNYRNFKDFGGLSISRVLSDKFEPLIVWHGTGQEFSYFRFDNFPAAYFAANRKYSDFFAEMHAEDKVGYVLPFFLSIKKPLDLTIFGLTDVAPQDFFDWLYVQTGLTPEELESVRQGAFTGLRLLSHLYGLADTLPYLHFQHERWNGSGYPEGLAQWDIPFGSRLLALCQAYQTMREPTAYRAKGMSKKKALLTLTEEAHILWDPLLVEELAKLECGSSTKKTSKKKTPSSEQLGN